MKTIITTIKNFLLGFVAGVISLAVFNHQQQASSSIKAVKTTQISGEKIEHSDFDYSSKDRIIFNTTADGKGKIKTEIPKENIPEAAAWMNHKNGIQFELLILNERIYSPSYWRRWNSFAFGAGVVFSENSFKGVKCGAQFWF